MNLCECTFDIYINQHKTGKMTISIRLNNAILKKLGKKLIPG